MIEGKETGDEGGTCPLAYGIESGVPVIGLGLFLILLVLVPFVTGVGIIPLPVALVIAGAGVFMIWAGLFR